MVRLGLISDTHGHLDYRVARAFADVDRILHAGDICGGAVLVELELLNKPTHVISGNCDRWEAPWASHPDKVRFEIAGVRFLLVHDKADAGSVSADNTDVVVFGHSHMPLVQEVSGVLWVNPGSASQARRSTIGRSVGILEIADNGDVNARVVSLDGFGDQKLAKRR